MINETDKPERRGRGRPMKVTGDETDLLMRTRRMAQYYKVERDRWQAEANRLRELYTPSDAVRQRADELADAAASLPDVVKTRDIRRALSNYRKAKKEYAS